MAYLPTGPLVAKLRLASCPPSVLGGGGNGKDQPRERDTGLENVAQELARITGREVDSARREIRRVLSGAVLFIREPTADAMACALGLHPSRVWCDWYGRTERNGDPGTATLKA